MHVEKREKALNMSFADLEKPILDLSHLTSTTDEVETITLTPVHPTMVHNPVPIKNLTKEEVSVLKKDKVPIKILDSQKSTNAVYSQSAEMGKVFLNNNVVCQVEMLSLMFCKPHKLC